MRFMSPLTPRLLVLDENTRGRDFIAGDVHLQIETLIQALDLLEVNPEVDRLFLTGDVVDRGTDASLLRGLLDQEWVYSVAGNHEEMLLDYLNNPEMYSNGAGHDWWYAVPEEDQQFLKYKLKSLPTAIQIGRFAIVHAEIPVGLAWDDVVAGLAAQDSALHSHLLWGTERADSLNRSLVSGIDLIYVGHHTVNTPSVLGNHVYIDTGAGYPSQGGKLTVMELGDIPSED